MSVREYTINLDLPGSERWRQVLADFASEFPQLRREITRLLEAYGYNLWIALALRSVTSIYSIRQSIMYYDELLSISQAVGLPFEQILLMQLMYEMHSACTTVVCKTAHEWTMFRTMDWALDFLKRLTIQVKFVRQGQAVCAATTWVGYCGLLTSCTPSYSVAVNYRRTVDQMNWSHLLRNIISVLTLAFPIGYLVRETVCDPSCNYSQALNRFKQTRLISPCYLTICPASIYEHPVIITRDPQGFVVHSNSHSVVQTNCDNDQTNSNNSHNILYSRERIEFCRRAIQRSTDPQHSRSANSLFDAMQSFPIINEETIYQCLIVPATQEYRVQLVNNQSIDQDADSSNRLLNILHNL